jgi:hypothetical protein
MKNKNNNSKISPNEMETINIWAEQSSNVADAYSREKNYPGATSENVVISWEDAANIRKDDGNVIFLKKK